MIPVQREALTRFTADNSDLLNKLKDNTKATKEFGDKSKDALDRIASAAEKIEKTYNSIGEAYKRATATATAALGAVDKVMAAVNNTAHRMTIEAAAAGEGLQILSRESAGLITRTQQLEFAAKLNTSAFKLSAAQYEDAANAVRQLVREGANQEDALKKVGEAITKFDGGPLQDFGIRTKQGTSDTEKFTNVMDALHQKALMVGTGTQTAGEKMAAYGVDTTNALDSIRTSIDSITASLAPFIAAIAKVLETLTSKEKLGNFLQGDHGQYSWHNMMRGSLETLGLSEDQIDQLANHPVLGGLFEPASGAYTTSTAEGAGAGQLGESNRQVTVQMPGMDMRRKAGSGPASGLDFSGVQLSGEQIAGGLMVFADMAKSIVDSLPTFDDIAKRQEEAAARAQGGADASAQWAQIEQYATANASSGSGFAFDKATADKAANDNKRQSFLEKTFGKVGEFDAYATAFQTLTGAVGASMTAWIDGSESAGKAFKHFIADALKGLAVQMAVEALKEGAYSIASFATGNVAGGIAHGKAALAFGVAAAAAAVGAKALGTSAGDANAASAGGGGGGGGSGGFGGGAPGSDGPKTIVIAMSSSDPDETARMAQRRAERYVARGLGAAGYGVSYK